PLPEILGLEIVPTTPLICQEVAFSPETILGEPPFTYAWTLRAPNGQAAASSTSESWTWQTSAATPPGNYNLELEASNVHGSDFASRSFSLVAPPPLAFTGPGGAPTADPPLDGDVQFHLQEQGASQWVWDFGDGTIETYSDPGTGRAPLHRYLAPGTYHVRVTIRNCLEPTGITSPPLTVQIQVVSLEILEFQATGGAACNSSLCAVQTLVPTTFNQAFAGGPTGFLYDWNGDGQTDQISSTPISQFVFPAPGSYWPRLTVTRAGQSVFEDHPVVIIANGGTGTPPAAPTGLSLEDLAATSLRLVWVDRATNEDSYRLDQRQGSAWVELLFLEANRREVLVEGLTPETSYVFRVRAVNLLGEGASSPVQVTTPSGGGGGLELIFADGFETGFSPWSRATLFTDDFETGDTRRWSQSQGSLAEADPSP
ncbi:MAG: PKD domain-containing protein, partial [Acidobacteria bacterium]|nr:PKD domain-containing protein [Acidobacteriota bacterium]